jgi:hypothetical protein
VGHDTPAEVASKPPRKDGDDLPLTGPDFEPTALLRSERFAPSSLAEEHQPVLCDPGVQFLLETVCEHAPAEAAATKVYQDALDVCREAAERERKDGLIVPNPLLEHFGREQDRLSKPYWAAYDRLMWAVEGEVLCIVIDALEAVGVTDPQTVKEAARCAMRGGAMWDGRGFTKPGETPQEPGPEPIPLTPADNQERLCPHCGNDVPADAARCPFCERLIG